jgi:vacuolar-type H+-ATPase subunit I/STV1
LLVLKITLPAARRVTKGLDRCRRKALNSGVERLEQKVSGLEQLPARVEELGSQIAQLRGEMHAEFSAIRNELADRPTRAEVREADEETRRLMRVLHEDVVQRIGFLGETRRTNGVAPKRKRRPRR